MSLYNDDSATDRTANNAGRALTSITSSITSSILGLLLLIGP